MYKKLKLVFKTKSTGCICLKKIKMLVLLFKFIPLNDCNPEFAPNYTNHSYYWEERGKKKNEMYLFYTVI